MLTFFVFLEVVFLDVVVFFDFAVDLVSFFSFETTVEDDLVILSFSDFKNLYQLENDLNQTIFDNEDKGIIINQTTESETINIEESLSLFDQEKKLIEKSLLKHKGKRKNAANELGISERTLYRKLKEFGL